MSSKGNETDSLRGGVSPKFRYQTLGSLSDEGSPSASNYGATSSSGEPAPKSPIHVNEDASISPRNSPLKPGGKSQWTPKGSDSPQNGAVVGGVGSEWDMKGAEYSAPPGGENNDTQNPIHETSLMNPPPPSPQNPALSNGTLSNTGDKEEDGSQQKDDEKKGFRNYTLVQKATLVVMCVTNFACCVFYSMLAPFYPTEAAKKGATQTEVGMIFGIIELAVVIFSPVFGILLPKIGAKFMFVSGLLVAGSCAVLFGVLDKAPNGIIYVAMCFITRTIEGMGMAAFQTACFTMAANTFREQVATVFGTLEMFTGLGFMAGPVIGGALFQVGGFMMPFFTVGILIIVVALGSWIFIPSQEELPSIQSSFLKLVKIPAVIIISLATASTSIGFGLIDVSLAVHLEKQGFNLSPILIGLIFLIGPGLYALVGPVFGWIGDTKGGVYQLMTAAYLGGAVAFLILGPAPFLNSIFPEKALWTYIVANVILGISFGPTVLTFKAILDIASEYGFEDNLNTYAMISGIVSCTFSLGAFAGPLVGGALQDSVGFAWGCVVLSGVCLFTAILIVILLVSRKIFNCCHGYDLQSDDREQATEAERQALLSSLERTH